MTTSDQVALKNAVSLSRPLAFSQVMCSYLRRADPFFDEQENHSLIGVANVFLSCLFYDVKLQYAVPIINQKGEVWTPRALSHTRTCTSTHGHSARNC